ncbi:hypothetical protein Tco_0236400 [Tanacetum coccineum]
MTYWGAMIISRLLKSSGIAVLHRDWEPIEEGVSRITKRDWMLGEAMKSSILDFLSDLIVGLVRGVGDFCGKQRSKPSEA